MKKEILRTNVFDKKKYQKSLLIRIAILKNGTTILNSQEGRGIYFKREDLNSNSKLDFLKYKIKQKKGNFDSIKIELEKILKGGD